MPASREKKRKTTQAQAFLVSTSDTLSTIVWTLRDVLKQLDVAGRTTKVCPVEERARRLKETGEAIKEARRSVEAVLAVATHLTATVIPRTPAALGGSEQVGVYRALIQLHHNRRMRRSRGRASLRAYPYPSRNRWRHPIERATNPPRLQSKLRKERRGRR
jgi:hypothetical protein